jgi:tetratricopeptide (TPR) repeat protein
MELQIALGSALTVILGSVEQTESVLAAALETAERLDDLDAQVRAFWALWAVYFNIGRCRTAQSVAERFLYVASRTGKPGIIAVADRVMGYTLQYLGDHNGSRRCFERVLDVYITPQDQRDQAWFLYDQRTLTEAMLARSLWLQGFADQAQVLARRSLADAEEADDKLTGCFVLALAVAPLALLAGDLVAARRSLDSLSETATRQGFTRYVLVGRCMEAALLIEEGEFAAGTALLAATLEAHEHSGWMASFTEYLCILARGIAGTGNIGEALNTIERALARANDGAERWYLPELLRLKGQLLLDENARSVSQAERCFTEAFEMARQQGATAWELRAAMSLARLMMAQDRPDAARETLFPVYRRFTQGFETADLRSAAALLDGLGV